MLLAELVLPVLTLLAGSVLTVLMLLAELVLTVLTVLAGSVLTVLIFLTELDPYCTDITS